MAIDIGTSFNVQTNLALDERMVLTTEEMLNMNDNIMPDVYIATNKDDGQLYLYNKANDIDAAIGKFRLMEGGGDIGIEVTQAEYDELKEQGKLLEDTNYYITDAESGGGFSEDIYSTEETKTNKTWIDGKPIYRRVIEINWADMTAVTDYNHVLDISEWNVDFPVSVNMTLYQEAAKWIVQNGAIVDTNYYRYITFTDVAITIVLGTIDKTRTPKFIVIVEYTKK